MNDVLCEVVTSRMGVVKIVDEDVDSGTGKSCRVWACENGDWRVGSARSGNGQVVT